MSAERPKIIDKEASNRVPPFYPEAELQLRMEIEKDKNPFDHEYHQLLRRILNEGKVEEEERTGTGTLKVIGHQMRFDLAEGFPLITTKKLYQKGIAHELLWMLEGETNNRYLNERGVTIWDEWADEDGELGPIYGHQWRSWPDYDGGHIDQISQVIEGIKENPASRRHIVSAWNVSQLDEMALQPCHTLFQFHVSEGKLSCQLYQRSGDTFLGVPFNIASYALLANMVAQATGYEPGEFIHEIGDAHLYLNHLDQAKEQITREPYPPPKLRLNPEVTNVFDFKYEDITVLDYQHHPHIKAEVSV